MMKLKLVFWTIALAGVVTSGSAPAQPQETGPDADMGPKNDDGLGLELGAGAFFQPEYKGSKHYKVRPLPWGSLSYRIGDRYIEISGPSLRANLLGGGRIEFGPILASEMGRDDDIDNLVVRRLGRTKSATMAGAFFSTDFDLGRGSAIQVGAEATADIGNTNKGKIAKFKIGYRRQFGEKWMVMTGISASWVDRNYMQTYCGVTPSGAAASGLPIYTARSGFENFELSSGLYRRLSPRLNIVAFARYQRLIGSAANSPIVRLEGSEHQLGLGIAIFRKF